MMIVVPSPRTIVSLDMTTKQFERHRTGKIRNGGVYDIRRRGREDACRHTYDVHGQHAHIPASQPANQPTSKRIIASDLQANYRFQPVGRAGKA